MLDSEAEGGRAALVYAADGAGTGARSSPRAEWTMSLFLDVRVQCPWAEAGRHPGGSWACKSRAPVRRVDLGVSSF